MKKFYKNGREAIICGVCAGISDGIKIDVSVIRLICFALCWFYGTGVLIYFLLAFILPDKREL